MRRRHDRCIGIVPGLAAFVVRDICRIILVRLVIVIRLVIFIRLVIVIRPVIFIHCPAAVAPPVQVEFTRDDAATVAPTSVGDIPHGDAGGPPAARGQRAAPRGRRQAPRSAVHELHLH